MISCRRDPAIYFTIHLRVRSICISAKAAGGPCRAVTHAYARVDRAPRAYDVLRTYVRTPPARAAYHRGAIAPAVIDNPRWLNLFTQCRRKLPVQPESTNVCCRQPTIARAVIDNPSWLNLFTQLVPSAGARQQDSYYLSRAGRVANPERKRGRNQAIIDAPRISATSRAQRRRPRTNERSFWFCPSADGPPRWDAGSRGLSRSRPVAAGDAAAWWPCAAWTSAQETGGLDDNVARAQVSTYYSWISERQRRWPTLPSPGCEGWSRDCWPRRRPAASSH
eukprot:SAG31_NODE_11890_length_988_cov_1.069741_1_plen_279_part_00